MIGQTISHYKILAKLGEGGMGVVYKAHDVRLRRDVAMKFLPADLAQDAERRDRFYIEARAASALNHPNVGTIYDIDEFEGEHFIAMELIEGTTLREKIGPPTLPIDEALGFALQIARGLYAAHQHGIVHRDIKPENIMVTEEGQVKIMDFGLAKLSGGTRLTIAGTTMGTVAYMSLEQVRGEDVDQRSDIWSFGALLYEMFTRTCPFQGDHITAMMFEIMNKEAPRLTEARTDVPRGLEDIVAKSLSKNPADRYQHLGELIPDLEMVKRGGVPTITIIRTAVRRSKPRWIIAAALVVLVAVGIFLFVLPPQRASANMKTIAVLPFNNMSGNPEDEHLSDGMTEDILTHLGKIADLKVISRTTMMQYKGSKKTLSEIGKELNAGVVLEGSVRRVADQLRITAQLIDAGSDAHLWAEMYDKDFTKVFAIQSDVAQKIAAALEAKLTASEKAQIEKQPTLNIEAYKVYLKGREYRSRHKKQDNETAIDLFKKAITLDSTFALAWAALGDAYSARYGFGMEISWLDSAVAVSKKAISLDSNSAEAYNALGIGYYFNGANYKALEAYRRAAELNPNYFAAIGNIGIIYTSEGRYDEALLWLKKATVLAPTNAVMPTQISYAYLQLGDVVQGERWLMKALELQPDYQYANIDLANLYALQNKGEQANELMKKVVAANPDDPRVFDNAGAVAEATGNLPLAKEYYQRSIKANPSFETDPGTTSGFALARILLKEGKRNEAQKLLNQARALQQKQIEEGDTSFDPLHYLAAISAIEGNTKEATAWLRKAIDAGFRDLDPNEPGSWLENLRNDREYKLIAAQFKTQLDSMRKRVEEMEGE
jgi:TolB-like protein/Flp pilus assembly protein TadD/predicted Ser/Thr protein kinase